MVNDDWWQAPPRAAAGSRLHWTTDVWPPFPHVAPVLIQQSVVPNVTGSSNDMVSRLTRLLPFAWWNDGSFNPFDNSFITAIKGGLGDGLSWTYSLLQYVKNQTRLTTSSDFFIDLSAFDFFGLRIKRKPSQTDSSLISTIQKEVFRERVTRHGIEQAIEDLTQGEATIFEPMNPQDSGGWGVAFAFDSGGGWGANLPYTMFITAIEPIGAGIPNLAGFDSYPGGWGVPQGVTSIMLGVSFSNGFSNAFGFLYILTGNGGSFALADLSQIQGLVTNQDIYNVIEATRAAGITCWVNITTPAVLSGLIGIDFTIGVTPIGDDSHTGVGAPLKRGPVTIIFAQTLSGIESGWGGFNLRVIIPSSTLSAGPTNQTRVTIQFASTATAASTLDSLWIGTAAPSGNAYNYAGNQVQLQFSGSNSLTMGPGLTIASDWSNFAYTGTGSNLIVAAHFTGATANLAANLGVGSQYFLSATDSGGTTAPGGAWTNETNFNLVNKIETQ